MMATWMLGAIAAGAFLGIAALAAERIAGWFRRPRRWIWIAAMAGSLLLPAAGVAFPGLLPRVRLPRWAAHRPTPNAASPAGDAVARNPGDAGPGGPAPSSHLPTVLFLAWTAASLATAGALGWSQRRLRASCGALAPSTVGRTPVFVAERAGPMVLGLVEPRIVLPRWAMDAPADELRLIVAHEREHVHAGDGWLLALAALAVAAMPWSPALWWQHRRLRLAVETDCDARVLARGADARDYGRVLLRTASHPFPLPTLALAWGGSPSHLERRILAMTEPRPRYRVLRALPLAAAAGMVAVAACTVASGTGRGTAGPVAQVTREVADGREVIRRDNGDGTETMMVGPAPGVDSLGTAGFSWVYRFDPSFQVTPGSLPSPRSMYAVVTNVEAGSPAAAAGLRPSDVILSANGVGVMGTLLLPDRRPGTAYDFRVRRGSAEMDVHLILGPPTRPQP